MRTNLRHSLDVTEYIADKYRPYALTNIISVFVFAVVIIIMLFLNKHGRNYVIVRHESYDAIQK